MAGNSKNMQVLRLSIVGFGTVGRWLADAIGHHRSWFEAEHGVAVTVVGVANRRDGFVYRAAGFDTTTLLEFVSAWRSLSLPRRASLGHRSRRSRSDRVRCDGRSEQH